jgi:hypothetical protein
MCRAVDRLSVMCRAVDRLSVMCILRNAEVK